MVQVNYATGPTNKLVYYLPYSLGTLWCYANHQPEIHRCYRLNQIIWRHHDIDKLADSLSQDDIVCFSTYIWNRQYHYALAKAIKLRNPHTFIIFGGPEPPVSNSTLFKQFPFIDVVIKGEGEEIFASVLQKLAKESSLIDVKGLLINQDSNPYFTGDAPRIQDLSILPSPYTLGFFDAIIDERPDVAWAATIETNRGCPYQCTFCDWGSLTYNKVKHFPLDRVLAEIDWLCKHADGVYCADANFGMFYDRDRKIIEHLVQMSSGNSVLRYWYVNWAKNHRNQVIDLVKLLHSAPNLKANGLTVSTQTMTPEVLDIIKRKNLRQQALEEIFQLTSQNDIPVHTELILGLPGETVTSWKRTVFEVFRAGNHHSTSISQCQVLQNSELNLVQRDIYQIKTHDWSDYFSARERKFQYDVPLETIPVVTSTSTASYHDLRELNAWNNFITATHMFGFSTQIAKFLYRRHGIDYEHFYHGLYELILVDTEFGSILQDLRDAYDERNQHGSMQRQLTGIYTSFFHLTFAIMLAEKDLADRMHDIIDSYATNYRSLLGDCEISLLRYQRNVCATWKNIQAGIKYQRCQWNFHGYLESNQELDQPITMQFSPHQLHHGLNRESYAAMIHYHRLSKFGLMEVQCDHDLD